MGEKGTRLRTLIFLRGMTWRLMSYTCSPGLILATDESK